MSRKRTNRNRRHPSIPDQRNVNHDFEDMDTMVFDFVHDLDEEDFVPFLDDSEDLSEDHLFDTQDLSSTPKEGKKKSWLYLFEDSEPEPVSSIDRFKTKEIPQIHRSTNMYESYQATKALDMILSTESALEWEYSASTPLPTSTIHWDMPLMVRSHGHVAYVSIGSKSIRLSGVRHGRKFLVHSQNVGCWGSGGPSITNEDKEKLMWILTEKSRLSPWMKFMFYDEGGRRIRYEKNGTRKRRTGLARMLDSLYYFVDDCDYGDRRDSSCV